MRTKVTKVKIPPQAKGWAPGRSKYRAIPTTVNDIRFASKHEAAHYQKLLALEQAGKISDLQLQVPFVLSVNGEKIGKLVLDFTYTENGVKVYEDIKSPPTMTRMFKWKAKHLKAQYGINIRVTM